MDVQRPFRPSPRVVAACEDCGEVRVPGSEVTLRRCADDDRWSYRFRCPSCHKPTVAPTAADQAAVLLAHGGAVEVWTYPAELAEPRTGPVLGALDLLELLRSLDDPAWVDALARRGS